jgi:ribosome silencing factor RsfS/YbeB/iojap
MTDELRNMELYLKEHSNEKRILHSTRTADEAVALANRYGADEHKALIAGLLHDVAKGACKRGLLDVAKKYHVDVDPVERDNPELLHGKVGAAMVQADLEIVDEDILSAIRWHTTGRAGMSLLEKIIYIADLIEPGRDFDGIDQIRVLANQDIDEAMLAALKQVMDFVKCKGFTLHPNSVEAYKFILNKKEALKGLNTSFNEDVVGAAKQLFAKKAEDVRVINVSHLTIIADYFILASGRSDVHVKSLCEEIRKYLHGKGREQLRIEGYREGRWIVIDYGDILIHIFHKREREFYGLERLWVDGNNFMVISDEDMEPRVIT